MRTFFFLLLPQVIDFPCSRLYLIQRLPFSIILDLKQSLVFDTATTSITDLRHHGLGFASGLPVSSFLSPNISMNLTNFGLGNGLVKISDTLLSVGMYFTSILPSSTASRIK